MNRDLRLKAIALSVLAAALAVSGSARANTISYSCPNDEYVETITIDLTKNTVSENDTGKRNIPAKITPASIDWRDVSGADVSIIHIDRKSGIYTVQFAQHRASGPAHLFPKVTYHCTWSMHP